MKKWIPWVVVGAILFAVVSVLFTVTVMLPIVVLGSTGAPETLLRRSTSPNGTYTLEACQINGGATVDFAVKVYQLEGTKRKLIYDAYHERDAEIIWRNDHTVSINGKELDLARGDRYDWRKSR